MSMVQQPKDLQRRVVVAQRLQKQSFQFTVVWALGRMETKPVITFLKTLLIVYSFVFWVS
ncbi:unnamed protein product [Oncorhynchus mykiss]|uniref:Uncharacterized protein n=1 Tax=Oncorhynchus mykiss TaxID=8022 RepID=A0A060YU29_ONCMY|nr:unnamed protein product [Oncorhynchus mykiss]